MTIQAKNSQEKTGSYIHYVIMVFVMAVAFSIIVWLWFELRETKMQQQYSQPVAKVSDNYGLSSAKKLTTQSSIK
ncbi:MAG: hypothetical protein SGJ10_01495 [Bacteroidota bacterium]|nr:hypothetical protein [Bacteroidota bacterium]